MLGRAALVLMVVAVACEGARAESDAPEPLAPTEEAVPGPQPSSPPEGSRFVEIGELGDEHHAARRVVAYVPAAHARDPSTRFPVLYVNDGQAAFTVLDLARIVDALTERGAIEPWIVVSIDATLERTAELARHADRYADFVADVVAPAVEAVLPVRAGPDSTAMLGYSYGGLAAVWAQLARPDRFGRVVAMSPSLWFRSRAVLDRFRRAAGTPPTRMWIDIGSLEGRRGDTVPYMVGDARALRDAAITRGMRFGADLGTYEAIGEPHDLLAAARRMETALAFALSRIDLSTARPRELRITRYDAPARARRRTFAIEARYDGALRLTWPVSAVDVRSGDRPVDGELVRRDAEIVAHLHGLEASSAH